jgi:hypothetical protein
VSQCAAHYFGLSYNPEDVARMGTFENTHGCYRNLGPIWLFNICGGDWS